LDKASIVDPISSDQFERYSEAFHRLRQLDGITRYDADRLVRQPHYFGIMMVHLKDADGFVGVCHNYYDEILPAFQVIEPKKPDGKAAALFIILFKKKVYFLADTGAIINPTAEELAEIAIESAKVVRLFDMEPRVAMLSFSNFGSIKHPATR
jgi:malate dehydrogenase (oxaloacetate-decarboxylating)(NADP+)